MDDTTRQARERREHAQDFLTANPNAHSVGIDGTTYDRNGYERSRNIDPQDMARASRSKASVAYGRYPRPNATPAPDGTD